MFGRPKLSTKALGKVAMVLLVLAIAAIYLQMYALKNIVFFIIIRALLIIAMLACIKYFRRRGTTSNKVPSRAPGGNVGCTVVK